MTLSPKVRELFMKIGCGPKAQAALVATISEEVRAEYAPLLAAVREWQDTLNVDERSLPHIIAKGKLAALAVPGVTKEGA